MDAQQLWQTAIERLEEQFPATACLPRFGETAAFSLVGDVLVVGLKSFATYSTLLHPYGSAIRKTLAEIVGHKRDSGPRLQRSQNSTNHLRSDDLRGMWLGVCGHPAQS